MKINKLVAAFLLLSTASLTAEVISSAADGFKIKIETEVKVSAEKAYQQFVKVNEWWSSEHSWFGDANNFSLNAKAGGCFCEISGEKEVLHMLVTYVDPGKEIRLTGGLGPLQMMGVHGGMSWQFVDLENGGSKIVQNYAVSGYSADALDKLAPIVDRVQSLQQQRLTDKINSK